MVLLEGSKEFIPDRQLRSKFLDLILSDILIPIEKDGMDEYLKAASKELKIDSGSIAITKILSKSLDIQNTEQFYYKISIVVSIAEHFENTRKFPEYREETRAEKKTTNSKARPLIVGFGPAGMFAALELIDFGIKPIIFERGKKIEDRSIDVQRFIKEREINTESNIQFGEGGAGSYSDGKLFSRRNNNSSYINRVLRTLVKFGAPREIEYISKPHLGTDVLCKIVRNIRRYILDRGGEIHYSAKMTDILITEGTASGIQINGEKDYLSSTIYIALGHSARDTYEMLHKNNISLEQKPISVGVRIEHPVKIINRMRYGNKYKDYKGIGAATYSLNYTNRKIRRGVYTFCMCPGGEVINASSDHGMMVVNGMSYSHRSSPFSNAALVVSCHTDDYPSTSPLAGLEFQKKIEQNAFRAGGGRWEAPAQNLMDFLGETSSVGLNDTLFKMGVAAADMREIVPGFVADELVAAFTKWKEDVPLFVSDQAILIGTETRTSSPVRIKRNKKYESENVKNIYPIGEGSGYTGGITSSAADAIKAVEKYVLSL
jgi:uncharacterized FAD-dependent dehydrogenase